MSYKNGVEFICVGGVGSEAEIHVELRSVFPGIGGVIRTFQAITVANRKEFNQSSDAGLRMFLKHTIIKKLEDYFFRKGIYRYAHITRPLGSMNEGYIYEWAFGSDRFSWYYPTETGDSISVELDDWKEFIEAFNNAGINIESDCTDADDGRISQNIIHQYPQYPKSIPPKLNRLWKRIDFGERSIGIDYDQLSRYLTNHQEVITNTLRVGRYDLLILASRYLQEGENMNPLERGKLEVLALDYRYSTLQHLNTRGVDSTGDVTIISKS